MRATIKQRADLTFKHNRKRGRHGWLRLTPAYSMKLVRKLIQQHPNAQRILDPFSGTGTTPLAAAEYGHVGVSLDINPFLVWLGNVKAAHYSEDVLVRTQDIGISAVQGVLQASVAPCTPPPIKNIERWWSPDSLDFLCRLKTAIDEQCNDRPVYDLLLVVLCRTLIALSNAAFNHQSMSFGDNGSSGTGQLSLLAASSRHERQFIRDLRFVLEAASDNPAGNAIVLLGDSRDLAVLDAHTVEPFDLLITSPPYPNRMSYIRELRPYMYWLSYLVEAREAGELDWDAIGGTWGIATSRLKDWTASESGRLPEYIYPILDRVRESHEKNGILMANYIHKYFEDISQHLHVVGRHLKRGATVHYIVGNSSFYGHVVPVEKLYADLLTSAGFEDSSVEIVRKRNSKKELYEYVVTARWPGHQGAVARWAGREGGKVMSDQGGERRVGGRRQGAPITRYPNHNNMTRRSLVTERSGFCRISRLCRESGVS